jgi:hypothetical protein
MNTARMVVLTVALGAGGIAGDLASAQLPTTDVPVASSDIASGQTLTLELTSRPTATLAGTRQGGTLSLRGIADVNVSADALDGSMQKRKGAPSETARI